MGRRKFRLSDMMPNSWFYLLRDMRRARGRSGAGGGASAMHQTTSSSSSLGAKGSTQPDGTPRPLPAPLPHRTSYYYASRDRPIQLPSPAPQPTTDAAEDRHQLAVPRTQSPSRIYKRRHRIGPVRRETTVPELAPDARHRRRDTCIGLDDGSGDVDGKLREPAVEAPSPKNTFTGKVIASDTDIIFDLHADGMPEMVLRPIVTRPARRETAHRYELKERHAVHVHHGAAEQGSRCSSRRSSVSSGRRLKTRANSPRLAASRCRKSSPRKPTPAPPSPLAESFAVVKASVDPRKDFLESMVEMIAEKGIRDAGDLEDLLACYLALNAAEHHDIIVEVFEEIWASLGGVDA